MTARLGALAWLAFGSLLFACAQPDLPPPGQVAAIPSCPNSEESGCESGMPLCAMDRQEQGECLLCRCTTFVPLASNVVHASEYAGVQRTDYSR